VPHFCLRHCLGVAWVWLGYGCQLVPYSKRSIRFEKCVQVFTMFTLVLIGSIICIYIYIYIIISLFGRRGVRCFLVGLKGRAFLIDPRWQQRFGQSLAKGITKREGRGPSRDKGELIFEAGTRHLHSWKKTPLEGCEVVPTVCICLNACGIVDM